MDILLVVAYYIGGMGLIVVISMAATKLLTKAAHKLNDRYDAKPLSKKNSSEPDSEQK